MLYSIGDLTGKQNAQVKNNLIDIQLIYLCVSHRTVVVIVNVNVICQVLLRYHCCLSLQITINEPV